jgi:CubicO group peptidase (beta-lactamase class C family)
MSLGKRILLCAALLSYAIYALAADLPSATPEAVGLSSQRLERIGAVLRAKVDAGEIPGYVALVARRGKVAYYEAYGTQDPTAKAPMSRDATFRIYSMTKPITRVAAMTLIEEGRV